jgi:hypothetical protein
MGVARRATLTTAGGAIAIVGGLTGVAACSGPPPVPPPVTVTATVLATVTVTPTPPPAAAPDPAAPPAPDPVPNAPAPVVEWGPAVDDGPRPGATGTPVLDGAGVPASYAVVAGDSFFDIAQRFNLPQQQLLRMNPQIYDFGETVYIGQLINLDWTKTG